MENNAVWIRGPELRVRWGSAGRPMANSTFYCRLKEGQLPKPEYPFGPAIPYWRLSKIEELEARAAPSSQPAAKDAAQAQQPTAPKRKPRSAPAAAAPVVVEQPPKRGGPRKSTAPAPQPTPATPPKRKRAGLAAVVST